MHDKAARDVIALHTQIEFRNLQLTSINYVAYVTVINVHRIIFRRALLIPIDLARVTRNCCWRA